ncbi:cuticle-degrading protease [Rhizoctonia solani]|uniref:Cuticle-degrading protease n=1 Tax=Rhizoctonia solani TaxID=456999 RepID=A0A8H8ST65_9AGAM|nr:cuticle-degrading protease [Rhizoctonia solani]QRW16754.1 cuticle-degrading protease [Rhizoctonia solani]
MKSFALVAAALVAQTFAAPTAIPITKLAGPSKENSYIIKLKDGCLQGLSRCPSFGIHWRTRLQGSLQGALEFSLLLGSIPVILQNNGQYENVFHGYAGVLKGPILEYIRRSSDVEYIQADTIYKINWEQGDESLASREIHTQEEASHLAGRAANGGGVDIYGLDTGILTTHTAFGGRATWGATYGGYASRDGNGHGTHTAGTAAGSGFGLATAANIIALASNYVVSRAASSGRPTIATMSLGGDIDSAIDSAVSSAISRGIHFTVAGGTKTRTQLTSPRPRCCRHTIGAVDSSNRKASFSNYGSVLDVWALGVNVRSAWIGSNSAVNTISGTSMATPQVAGILAVVIGNKGNSSPAALSSALKSNAQAVVTGAPSGTTNLKARVW